MDSFTIPMSATHDGITYLLRQDDDGFFAARVDAASGDLLIDDPKLNDILRQQDNAVFALFAIGDYHGA